MSGSETFSEEFMASRISGSRWIFCTGIESGPDHPVQNSGEPHKSSADAKSFDAAEKFRRNLAGNDANRDAADQDHQARTAGADGGQLSDVRGRPFLGHDESPKLSGSRWRIPSNHHGANISLLQISVE